LKYQKIPALTGLELIKLLKKDGWIEHRQATHGIALVKRFKEGTKITPFLWSEIEVKPGWKWPLNILSPNFN
jgi:predicted RNA binding protein YcfA (HicA-like mRNA interferase family)